MRLSFATCTKALAFGFCLIPCATSATAGDYIIRFDATVVTVNQAPSAPFQGATVGDTVTGVWEVFNVPTQTSPSYWQYDMDLNHSRIMVGAALAPVSMGTGTQTVGLASAPAGMGGDFLIVTGEVSATTNETFVLALFDSTGGLFPAADISQCVGTYSGPFPPDTARIVFHYPGMMDDSLVADIQSLTIEPVFTSVGTPFCDPAVANSTGFGAVLSGYAGSNVGANLHLEITDGPAGEFGYFLVGTATLMTGLPVGNGSLCLDPAQPLGRYNQIGGDRFSLGQFDAMGVMQNVAGTSIIGSGFDVPSTLPLPSDPLILSGETWHFQAWYRDTPAGIGQSNLPNGLTVTFP